MNRPRVITIAEDAVQTKKLTRSQRLKLVVEKIKKENADIDSEKKEHIHIQASQSKEVNIDKSGTENSVQVAEKETSVSEVTEKSNQTHTAASSEITQIKKQETGKNAAQTSDETDAPHVKARELIEENNDDDNEKNTHPQNDDKLNNNHNAKVDNNSIENLQQQFNTCINKTKSSFYSSSTAIDTEAIQYDKLKATLQICNSVKNAICNNSITTEEAKENVKFKEPIENKKICLKTSVEKGISQSKRKYGTQKKACGAFKQLERQLEKIQHDECNERENIKTSYTTDVANNSNFDGATNAHKSTNENIKDTSTNENIEDSQRITGAKSKLRIWKQIGSEQNSAKEEVIIPVQIGSEQNTAKEEVIIPITPSFEAAILMIKHSSDEKGRLEQALEIKESRPTIQSNKETNITGNDKANIQSIFSLRDLRSENMQDVIELEREKHERPACGMASDLRYNPIITNVEVYQNIKNEILAQAYQSHILRSTTKNEIKPKPQSKIGKDTYSRYDSTLQRTSFHPVQRNIPQATPQQSQLHSYNIRSMETLRSTTFPDMQPVLEQRVFHPVQRNIPQATPRHIQLHRYNIKKMETLRSTTFRDMQPVLEQRVSHPVQRNIPQHTPLQYSAQTRRIPQATPRQSQLHSYNIRSMETPRSTNVSRNSDSCRLS